MSGEIPDIPPHMPKVYRRLQRWRSAHTGRWPIPERIWAAVVELAREHGVFPAAKALRLEYGNLRERAQAAGSAAKSHGAKSLTRVRHRAPPSTSPPTFVKLTAPRSGGLTSGVVELEGPRGRMKIELKGVATAELVVLTRALWEGWAPNERGGA